MTCFSFLLIFFVGLNHQFPLGPVPFYPCLMIKSQPCSLSLLCKFKFGIMFDDEILIVNHCLTFKSEFFTMFHGKILCADHSWWLNLNCSPCLKVKPPILPIALCQEAGWAPAICIYGCNRSHIQWQATATAASLEWPWWWLVRVSLLSLLEYGRIKQASELL